MRVCLSQNSVTNLAREASHQNKVPGKNSSKFQGDAFGGNFSYTADLETNLPLRTYFPMEAAGYFCW